MTKIFITGATGYIGGDVLYALTDRHPEFSYSALVRSQEKAERVNAKYPFVRCVLGDLDNSTLLERESANADIVIHTADASDHVGAANAIAKGLAAGHTKEKPGYWLHTGGTGILTYEDSDRQVFGEKSDKVYDDLDGLAELTNLPDHAFHRNVDKIVLEAAKTENVKTALICPPTIYGTGRGPGSQRSRQVYELAKVTLQYKTAPIIRSGQSYWNDVHVHDLSDLYCLLVETVVTGERRDVDGVWGESAYYLAENGEHRWRGVAEEIAHCAASLGYIPEARTESLNDIEEAKRLAGFESLSWGMNSRGRARRARKLLGWNPSRPSLKDEIPNIVKEEWQRLQQ